MNLERFEPFFGTPHIEGYSDNELLKKAKQLAKSLYAIDLNNQTIDKANYSSIMKLFEIIRFSGKKWPYLLALNFEETRKVFSVELWHDPRYNRSGDIPTALKGSTISFPNLFVLSQDPKKLIDRIKFMTNPENSDIKSQKLCFVGSDDFHLFLGRPNEEYFNDNKSIYTIKPYLKK